MSYTRRMRASAAAAVGVESPSFTVLVGSETSQGFSPCPCPCPIFLLLQLRQPLVEPIFRVQGGHRIAKVLAPSDRKLLGNCRVGLADNGFCLGRRVYGTSQRVRRSTGKESRTGRYRIARSVEGQRGHANLSWRNRSPGGLDYGHANQRRKKNYDRAQFGSTLDALARASLTRRVGVARSRTVI